MRGDARKRAAEQSTPPPVDVLAELRFLAAEWIDGNTDHQDDYLRGFHAGMANAAELIRVRIGPGQP